MVRRVLHDATMPSSNRGPLAILKSSAKDFMADNCMLRAAALSYYTVFALPPLLILLTMLVGAIWSPETVQQALQTQFAGLVGADGGKVVSDMIASGQRGNRNVLGTVLGFAGLLFGATGAFVSLQEALNRVWEVKPDPARGGLKIFLTKRLLSLGMLMGFVFLMVVSLAVTAALSALKTAIGDVGIVLQVVNVVVSLVILGGIFATMFKYLPDAQIAWKDVAVGGIATALLFELGKFVIGLYLGRGNPTRAFGAASALAVIFIWVYYAGILVLFGAEFTKEWAQRRGQGIKPEQGAVRVREEERLERDGVSRRTKSA